MYAFKLIPLYTSTTWINTHPRVARERERERDLGRRDWGECMGERERRNIRGDERVYRIQGVRACVRACVRVCVTTYVRLLAGAVRPGFVQLLLIHRSELWASVQMSVEGYSGFLFW